MGRPSLYTQELADEICSQLAEGKSLRTVCTAETMPSKSTVFKWLREVKAFSDQYARAKEESADALADEMLDIADDSERDYNGEKLNGENIQRARLRVDTRKWIAAKLKPKKYGDKTILSGDEDNPVGVTLLKVEWAAPPEENGD